MESPIERAIREALESGEWKGLPGEGRPLADDGLATDEHWAAKHVVQNEKAVPEWVDLRREIDERTDRLTARARRHLAWLAERRAIVARMPAERIVEAVQRTEEADSRQRAEISSALVELNALIRRYDLLVPVLSLQLPLLTSERLWQSAAA